MRFACLVTGYPTQYTLERYGDYSQMFKELLSQPGDSWTSFDCQSMAFPEDPCDFDVLVVTGSAADAHADAPWIRELNQYLALAHQKKVKILGFCFGHQAVANALGGRTGRNSAGWEAGLHEMQLLPPFLETPYGAGMAPFRILEIHQDHVIEAPPEAQVLAKTPDTPVQIFAIGDRVFCMQGHPEFKSDIVRDLVEGRGERGIMAPEFVKKALSTLDDEPDRSTLLSLLNRFLGRPGPS